MRVSWTALFVAGAVAAVLGAGGCEKEKGPAERAGERIDNAVDELAGKKGPAERAGEKVDKALDTTNRRHD